MIWGAWGGIVAGVIATGGVIAGEALPASIASYGLLGFFYVSSVASIKNWLGRPR